MSVWDLEVVGPSSIFKVILKDEVLGKILSTLDLISEYHFIMSQENER